MNRRRVANPIAVRRFHDAEPPGPDVVLTIGKPRHDPRGEWYCAVLIEVDGQGGRRTRVRGHDALQALQLALRFARTSLDALGRPLVWLEDGAPGDVGIPLGPSGGWGLDLQLRIERNIEEEERVFSEGVVAFLRERARISKR
jgi:hypothetical protein